MEGPKTRKPIEKMERSHLFTAIYTLPAHELMEGPKGVLLPHVKKENCRKEVDSLRVTNLHVAANPQPFIGACAFSRVGLTQGEGKKKQGMGKEVEGWGKCVIADDRQGVMIGIWGLGFWV